jgi:hypothetical protein
VEILSEKLIDISDILSCCKIGGADSSSLKIAIHEWPCFGKQYVQNLDAFALNFFCVDVMYSGEYDACDVTLKPWAN